MVVETVTWRESRDEEDKTLRAGIREVASVEKTHVAGRATLQAEAQARVIEQIISDWEQQLVVYATDDKIDVARTQAGLPYLPAAAAELLADKTAGCVTFVDGGTWLVWTGQVHARDQDSVVEHKLLRGFRNAYARALALVEAGLKADYGDDGAGRDAYLTDFKKHRAFRDKLNTSTRDLREFFTKALTVSQVRFDETNQWFVCGNGVLDLFEIAQLAREGGAGALDSVRIYDHSPRRRVTLATDVHVPETVNDKGERVVDLSARDGLWRWYLGRTLRGVEGLEDYLQKWVGSAMFGEPKSKGMVNLVGPPDSGKSLFTHMLLRMFAAYAKPVAAGSLVEGFSDNFAIHEFRGSRVVVATEPPAGRKLHDATIKALTGEDKQNSRGAYTKFAIEWQPQCTLFVASNHPLSWAATDVALTQRVKPIPFPNSFSRDPGAPEESRADVDLKSKLEAPGELAEALGWAVQGMLMFLEQGLGEEPKIVSELRAQQQAEGEPPLQWVDEAVEQGEIRKVSVEEDRTTFMSSRLQVAEAYKRYQRWSEVNGEKAWTLKRFSMTVAALHSEGGKTVRSGGKVFSRLAPGETWENQDEAHINAYLEAKKKSMSLS